MESLTLDEPLYEPLQGAQIRVVTLESAPNAPDIRCKLHIVELSETLEFHALSYVWGAPKEKKKIYVDSRAFEATANLFSFLDMAVKSPEVLRDRLLQRNAGTVQKSSEERGIHRMYWWIDAICINQADTDEKNTQVPRMDAIYSSASHVWVWLGLPSQTLAPGPGSGGTVELRQGLAMVRDEAGMANATPLAARLGASFPAFLEQYGALLRNPWFTRTWVVQEFVLSRRPPIALLGSFDFILNFVYAAGMRILREQASLDGASQAYFHNLLGDIEGIAKMVVASAWHQNLPTGDMVNFGGLNPGEKLLHLVRQLSSKQATVAHDHLYGLLGLVDAKLLPKELMPDYRLPFEKVCQAYARYIIRSSNSLMIIECHKSSLKDCPSWVPDIRHISKHKDAKTKASNLSFSDDGQRLTVQGTLLGSVICCGCSRGDAGADYLAFVEDTILTGRADITDQSLETVFAEWMRTQVETNRLPQDILAFRSLDELMEAYLAPFPSIYTGVAALENLSADVKLRSVFGNSASGPFSPSHTQLLYTLLRLARPRYCLLDTGEVMVCALKDSEAGHEPGDEVWALKGCAHAAVLRSREEQQYEYAGYQWSLGGVEFDEEFFGEQKVRDVVLV